MATRCPLGWRGRGVAIRCVCGIGEQQGPTALSSLEPKYVIESLRYFKRSFKYPVLFFFSDV